MKRTTSRPTDSSKGRPKQTDQQTDQKNDQKNDQRTDRQTNGPTDRPTKRMTDRPSRERPTDQQTYIDRQINQQTDRPLRSSSHAYLLIEFIYTKSVRDSLNELNPRPCRFMTDQTHRPTS